MRRLVPGIAELLFLAALALACAIVVVFAGPREGALLACGFAMLLVSMLLGARRAGHLKARRKQASRQEQEAPAMCSEL